MHGRAPGLAAVPTTGAGLQGLHERTAGQETGGAAEKKRTSQCPPLRHHLLQEDENQHPDRSQEEETLKYEPGGVKLVNSLWE